MIQIHSVFHRRHLTCHYVMTLLMIIDDSVPHALYAFGNWQQAFCFNNVDTVSCLLVFS